MPTRFSGQPFAATPLSGWPYLPFMLFFGCFAFASVYAWLPPALVAAEGALRSTRFTTRAAWWGLAGIGMSHIVAAWLGQGTYYAALLIGGYMAYRTLLVSPVGAKAGGRARLGRLLQHEAGVVVFAAA